MPQIDPERVLALADFIHLVHDAFKLPRAGGMVGARSIIEVQGILELHGWCDIDERDSRRFRPDWGLACQHLDAFEGYVNRERERHSFMRLCTPDGLIQVIICTDAVVGREQTGQYWSASIRVHAPIEQGESEVQLLGMYRWYSQVPGLVLEESSPGYLVANFSILPWAFELVTDENALRRHWLGMSSESMQCWFILGLIFRALGKERVGPGTDADKLWRILGLQ